MLIIRRRNFRLRKHWPSTVLSVSFCVSLCLFVGSSSTQNDAQLNVHRHTVQLVQGDSALKCQLSFRYDAMERASCFIALNQADDDAWSSTTPAGRGKKPTDADLLEQLRRQSSFRTPGNQRSCFGRRCVSRSISVALACFRTTEFTLELGLNQSFVTSEMLDLATVARFDDNENDARDKVADDAASGDSAARTSTIDENNNNNNADDSGSMLTPLRRKTWPIAIVLTTQCGVGVRTLVTLVAVFSHADKSRLVAKAVVQRVLWHSRWYELNEFFGSVAVDVERPTVGAKSDERDNNANANANADDDDDRSDVVVDIKSDVALSESDNSDEGATCLVCLSAGRSVVGACAAPCAPFVGQLNRRSAALSPPLHVPRVRRRAARPQQSLSAVPRSRAYVTSLACSLVSHNDSPPVTLLQLDVGAPPPDEAPNAVNDDM